MTKEQAQNKICPFMPQCINPDQAFDANFAVYKYQGCLTTDCIAWDDRWCECKRLENPK